MKKPFRIFMGLALAFSIIMSSCSTTREAEAEVGDELADFRSWVSATTSNVADRTEEDWQQAKEEFRTRTQELDQKEDKFSEELKQDYQELKQQFESADAAYAQNASGADLSEWERNLMGRWADYASINETNVQEAYITFMENVRQQSETWRDQEWEMAKQVLEKLNQRKSEITGDIATETEVKIKALQMEFRTLETAADATDSN